MSAQQPPGRTGRPVIPIQVAPARAPAADAKAKVADACCGGDEETPHGHAHHDHQHGHDHSHGHDHADACCTPAAQAAQISRPTAAPPGTTHVRYRIDAMDCPTEERLIRNRLEPMTGVARLDFNLLARELTVHHQPGDAQVFEDALIELG